MNTIVENDSDRKILSKNSACGRPFSFVGSSGSLLQTREKFLNQDKAWCAFKSHHTFGISKVSDDEKGVHKAMYKQKELRFIKF